MCSSMRRTALLASCVTIASALRSSPSARHHVPRTQPTRRDALLAPLLVVAAAAAAPSARAFDNAIPESAKYAERKKRR